MISPIENNGMVLRTQDFSTIRQNENNQNLVTHSQIQGDLDRTEDAAAHSVISKDDADKANTNHDAKEEGRNKYYNNRKKSIKKDDLDEGVVVKKNTAKFDISI